MNPPVPAVSALTDLTPVIIGGADARTFLQGQLSNDLRRLTPQHALLASCNSAQGRVQAVLTLIERDEGIIAVVPATMAKRLVTRLRGYVLRSRVNLVDEPTHVLAPLTAAQASGVVDALPQTPGACVTQGLLSLLRWWSTEERYLLVAPRTAVQATDDVAADLRWRRADIAAGLPQVYPETHESFVAQMLNLDLLGGISFDKGCYTGQEIVARTHYRGTIKRRMLRFTANCPAPAPGTRVLQAGTHAGEVVDACATDQAPGSGCELLAVISVDRMGGALALDGMAGSSLTRLELPYVIPQAEAA
jgi:folate-binding protein YgfZ